ncbi:MAG: 4Fe-4S dicluster domain-containing protein [Candidatus Firestonebacteria bacterium]|nr:4Fe-4S dicluster domain-containing protein [Candidatus Firestonebacteria bacterium]
MKGLEKLKKSPISVSDCTGRQKGGFDRMLIKQKVIINKEKCKGCGYCIEFCNKKNLAFSAGYNQKNFLYPEFTDRENKCNSCALCALMCPEAAIEVYKEK